jgi:hypothetical protein
MGENGNGSSSEHEMLRFFEELLDDRIQELEDDSDELGVLGAGSLTLKPIFWADAPWRIVNIGNNVVIPFTFIFRDAKGGILEEIAIWETEDRKKEWDQRNWQFVERFPSINTQKPDIDSMYWVYRDNHGDRPIMLPLNQFSSIENHKFLDLKVSYAFQYEEEKIEGWQPLRILLASESFPLRDHAQWYYGDTHYHSNYTNDFKEFGNPIVDTREAGLCIGLQWLTITDHSVDLDDRNIYWENPKTNSRWNDYRIDVAAHSDEKFRIIEGEELSLFGYPTRGDDTLHMLVYGKNLEHMIPGAFSTPKLYSRLITKLLKFSEYQDYLEPLFGKIYHLREVLIGKDLEGNDVPELRSRSVRAQDALAFAAHPSFTAQGKGSTWGEKDIKDLCMYGHGMEAWNSNTRNIAEKETNPIEHWTPWSHPKDLSTEGIKKWDDALVAKVGMNNPRFVLLGGSDAHGSFNYSIGWWYWPQDMNAKRADDNCLGKVRTALYLPYREYDEKHAPTEDEIIWALRRGSCVVTDGPLVNLLLEYQGKQHTLGDIIDLKGDDDQIDLFIAAHTILREFGPVKGVDIRMHFNDDEFRDKNIVYNNGHEDHFEDLIPTKPGFLYLKLKTQSPTGQIYQCYTNPIYFKGRGSGQHTLRVHCIEQIELVRAFDEMNT